MSGPLPGLLAPLALPASWLYGRVIAARNAKYDRGDGVQRVDVPVISVGNITTGGTGKTPMVAWIAELLINNDILPAIAMRGYGASDGRVSDEAAEYMDRLPGIEVIAHPHRFTAVSTHLAEHPETQCIILDDGFQHRRLHRDLDLVLIDATRDTFGDRLLPAGHLREPLQNLARADAVIVTRAESDNSNFKSQISDSDSRISIIESQIERYHGRAPIAWSRHIWTGLCTYARESDSEQVLPVTWLAGKRIVTLLGVGNPKAIIAQLEDAGAKVFADINARDHERFSRAKLALARAAVEYADALVLTAKDWARSRDVIDLTRWSAPIVVPQLVIDVFNGGEDLERLLLAVARREAASGIDTRNCELGTRNS